MAEEKILGFSYEALYNQGIIGEAYLRPDQLTLYDLLHDKKKLVVNTHRRWGKSTTAFTYIFERCLTEKIIVRVGGVTMKSLKDIFSTLVDAIFEHAPKLKPKYNHEDGCYEFKTGSRVFLFGNSDKAEADKARGALSHIIYCDEYGFWAYRAKYMLTSVLSPQLDTTDGQLIITSTPPEDLTHDYINQVSEAGVGDYYFKHDILASLACGAVDKATHEKIIMRCGGVDSDAYKREYLCMLIASTSRLVVPEAQNETLYTIPQYTRPTHFQPYVFLDLGLKDMSFALFGYWDFVARKLVIEDEISINYTTTEHLSNKLKAKEAELGYKHTLRYADNEMQQIFDMCNTYHYQISPITKARKGEQNNDGYRESIINKLRVDVSLGTLKITESCPKLKRQLMYGIWNEQRNDFERTQELGHLDGLMCLAYMNYHIDRSTNPYPHPWLAHTGKIDWFVPKIFRKKGIRDIY